MMMMINEVSSFDYIWHFITKTELEGFLHTNFFGNPLFISAQNTLEIMQYIFKMRINFY